MMVGRETEVSELLGRYDCNEAQFVAVYGRRRVDNTRMHYSMEP